MFVRPRPFSKPHILASFALWALLALLLLCQVSVKAQPVIAENAGANVSPVALKLVEFAVLRDVKPTVGLPEILAGQAGTFVPQAPLYIEDAGWGDTDLWLRLTLQGMALPEGQAAPALFLLEFPKSYFDDIRLYSPPKAGSIAWRVQMAGDMLAQKDWYLRSLYPRFLLPSAQQVLASPGGQQVLYVRIRHLFPMTAKLQINSAAQSAASAQGTILALGLVLGAMLFTAVLSLMIFLLNRDSIFGWYFAYAMAAFLATASHSGLAHMLLWPIGGYWPGRATLFWLLMVGMFQLQFCRVLFQPSSTKTWPSWAAIALGSLCGITAVMYALLPQYWTQLYFLSMGWVFLTIGLSIWLVFLAWRQGNKLALAWMLAFIPLFFTVALGLLGSVGVLDDGLGYNLPIYASAVEVILLGLAIQWFARERHGQMEREKALAATDPLTGFVTAEVFQNRLLSVWHSSEVSQHDMAVVYIQLQTKATSKKHQEQLLTRSVRILRSATHAHDVVARLDGQLMAILMPHVQMGDDLSQRLSRIVALGLIPDRSDPNASILQFRIAATTHWHYSWPLTQLHTDLRALLAEPSGWGSKPIRYLARSAAKRQPLMAKNTSALEDVWDRALDQQLQDSQSPIKQPT
jgi:two-component system, sensor histidine kinase LadS